MKKKILVLIVFILIIILLINIFNNKKNEGNKIPTFNSDIVCTKDINEIDDEGDEIKSKSIIYIDQNDEYIGKLTYVSIVESDFPTSYKSLVDSVMDMYNNIDGINAYSVIEDKKIASVVEYTFRNLDLNKLKREMGDILESNSVFMNIDELPIKYDYYKDNYLKGYECKQKND